MPRAPLPERSPRSPAELAARFFTPSRIYGETQHSYPLEVLSQVFGGGTTSRLYRSLVIEQKLALGRLVL